MEIYKVYIQKFAVAPLARGVKRQWVLSRAAIFGDLGGYFFGNFRDNSSNIIRRYATPFRPASGCKMNDLEWPWVAISCQNPFSASTQNVSFLQRVSRLAMQKEKS